MNRREAIIVWTLATILILELLILLLLTYLARLPDFFFIFIRTIKLISPYFLGANVIFLIYNLFTKGRELTIKTWKAYLLEFLRLFLFSFLATLVLIAASALLGASIGILLRRVYSFPTVKETLNAIKEWIAKNFY